MDKFKYSIVMRCNSQQGKELVSELNKLGYIADYISNQASIITYKNGNTWQREDFLDWVGDTSNRDEHIILEEYNKELFLALASVRGSEEFHIGEYITTDKEYGHGQIKMGKLHKIIGFGPDKWLRFNEFTLIGGGYNSHRPEGLRKANKQEILNYFNQKQTKNQQVMTNKTRFTVNASSSKALKEAVIAELKERGFKPHSAKTDSEFINNASYCLTQMSGSNVKEYQVEEKGSNPANQTNPKDRHYELPQFWTEAFKAWEEYCKAPVKKKNEVFSIEYEGGDDYLHFNITQGDAIQVYTDEDDATNNEKEDCENGEYLGEITKSQLEAVIAANKIKLGTWNTYDITVSTISIGCKANMAVEDFQTLLDIYNRINS